MKAMRRQPADRHSAATEVLQRTTVEFQHDRGIVYVYGNDGSPLLKITGLPKHIPQLRDAGDLRQLTVDIGDSAICNWGPSPNLQACSHPMPQTQEGALSHDDGADDTRRILESAGATIVAKGAQESK